MTCEKLWWLIKHGERWLRPENRAAGIMVGRRSCCSTLLADDMQLKLHLRRGCAGQLPH